MKPLNKSLILLRGLPGSGKSTLAKELSEGGKYPVYSVDDYFTDGNSGKYVFNHEENHFAYKLCQANTFKALQGGIRKVIVDNTFTLDWEVEPYFKLAKDWNYRIFVVTVENYHSGKNVHHVSDEQLKKMAEKYKVKLF